MTKNRWSLVAAACSLLLATCTSADRELGRVPVIVDYSPTVSDVGALMYLLAHPGVEVIAVSLPATGEAGCELGLEVTLGILAMFSSDAPVACQREFPPAARSWPEAFLSAQENLALTLPSPVGEVSRLDAPDLIAEAASRSGRPVLLAVAPLTAVAEALRAHPGLAGQLERIVIMGGALDVEGNVEGTGAEWNLWIDPASAAAVFGSGVPITLVPLDATNDVPAPLYDRVFETAPKTDAIRYLERMVRIFPSVTSGFYYLWDELAASVAAGGGLVETEVVNVSIVTAGPDAGRTLRDASGVPVTVATGVPDPRAFYGEFLGRLAAGPVDVGRDASAAEDAYLRSVDASLGRLDTAFESVFASIEGQAAFDVVAVITPLLDAIAVIRSEVTLLDAPPSLQAGHGRFLEVLGNIIAAREEILASAAKVSSFEELVLPEGTELWAACDQLRAEAQWLGVDVDLRC